MAEITGMFSRLLARPMMVNIARKSLRATVDFALNIRQPLRMAEEISPFVILPPLFMTHPAISYGGLLASYEHAEEKILTSKLFSQIMIRYLDNDLVKRIYDRMTERDLKPYN